MQFVIVFLPLLQT